MDSNYLIKEIAEDLGEEKEAEQICKVMGLNKE